MSLNSNVCPVCLIKINKFVLNNKIVIGNDKQFYHKNCYKNNFKKKKFNFKLEKLEPLMTDNYTIFEESYNCPKCYGLINKNLPFEPYIIGKDKLHYHLDCYDPKIRKLPRIDTTLISDKGNRLIFSGNLNNTISKKY